MAPIYCGLDMAEFKWNKFGSMWNSDYHLRRSKFVAYQAAMILGIVSNSLGTAALTDYIDEQNFVQARDPTASVFNNNYIGAASFNIFASIFVSFVLGGAFFFDLMWPERQESRGVRTAWKICGVLSVVFALAATTALTVVTITQTGHIVSADVAHTASILQMFHKDGGVPLIYKHNGRALVAVIFGWMSFAFVIPSCILLFLSIRHSEKGQGPWSTHMREHMAEKGVVEDSECAEVDDAPLARHPTHAARDGGAAAPRAPPTAE